MNASEILFYTTPQGDVRIEVFFEDETFWLSQKKIAELFDKDVRTVNEHLGRIFEEGELTPEATIRKFRIVQREGVRDVERLVDHYNLDAIIAVGYRANSARATKFRIWATNTLKEFIIKGFVLDDARLKQGKRFGQDYFEELLERIREIRASERRFYEKITDIYKECSRDYDANDEVTRLFYKTVQNKLHWAIHHHTAAELIAERAKAELPHMGLTTWKNAPDGKVLKSDVAVAKNYLNAEELTELDRIVGMYLDYAENQAKRGITMYMKDWAGKLDAFLQFNDYNVLKDAGKVSHDVAVKLAEGEYEKFRVRQDRAYVSDFDKAVQRLTAGKNPSAKKDKSGRTPKRS
ncbi:MAG: virulence RhuM family protein [Flavobacteriales bacterium]